MKVKDLIELLNKYGAQMVISDSFDGLEVDVDGVMLNDLCGYFGRRQDSESKGTNGPVEPV